jgi:hypothetical protein
MTTDNDALRCIAEMYFLALKLFYQMLFIYDENEGKNYF